MELLERLRIILCYDYISDLRLRTPYNCDLNEIYKIPHSNYSLDEWNKALGYITGKYSDCTTIDIAKQNVIEFFSQCKNSLNLERKII